jgi:hypothetical protein
MVDWHFAVLVVAFIIPVCANQHEGFAHGSLEKTGIHLASKKALGGHAGHADSIFSKKFRSQHAHLISPKIKAHHARIRHQTSAKATDLIEHHPHAKAATAAGLAKNEMAKPLKVAAPKQHLTFPLHKAEGASAKLDPAQLTKVAATKQHPTFPLHKDGRAITSPVKWEGFNPRHASEILEVLSRQQTPTRCHCMID